MGICFSKKKKKKQTLISDPNPKEALVLEVKEVKKPKNKNPIQIRTQTQKVEVEVELREEVKPPNEAQPTVEKKKPAVFVSTEKPIDNDEEPLPATVRTSSCSKEEVDAILIQCGRLSRSSSSKAAAAAAADRRYSGSKRSYDFDNDKSLMDEEVENHIMSRPSPSPSPRGKRTPNRERNGGGGGGASRRVSRSPGRRSAEGVGALNVGERNAKQQQQQQPAKMVSVPAREKGVSSTGSAKKGGGGAAASTTNRRNASSARSRSPANNGRVLSENAGVHQVQPQLLSRSSSRKAENSPSRRNPMTEIDENSLRGNNTTNKKKTTDVVTIKKNNNINSFVREQLKSCRQKEEKEKEKEKEPEIVEEGKEMKEEEMFNNRALTRTRSSRKSSRDFDHILGLNYPDTNATTAYTSSSSSLLVEDIQNYHQVSLPACVSKACSILEAVADLNSSSSDQPNSRFARRGLNQKDPFVETEVKGKDDLMEPCLEKYTSEMEPQESAGSNSIVGQPWHSSWEMNSVDSTDRYWTTSQSNHGEEPDEESSAIRDFESRGKSLRGGGSSSSNNSLPNATGSSGNKRRDFDNRQVVRGGGGNAKGGGRRALSNPVAAASSS